LFKVWAEGPNTARFLSVDDARPKNQLAVCASSPTIVEDPVSLSRSSFIGP
jgi:hypothetical protein